MTSPSDPACYGCGAPVCRCLASVPEPLRWCAACRAKGLHRPPPETAARPMERRP